MLMSDWNKLLESKQAQRLMGDRETVEHLKNAPQSQRLMELLSQREDAEQAAAAAEAGDTGPLLGVFRRLMDDPESRRLLEQIKQELPF